MTRMRTTLIIISSAMLLLSLSCVSQQTASPEPDGLLSGEWIDLTHDFSEETVYWVNAEPFNREGTAGMSPAGFFYAAGNYSAAEHGGTHIDSPIHFAEGKNTTEKIPLDQLIGWAVKLDISANAASNRDYLITVYDIQKWEASNGNIPVGSIVLFQTGFGKYWPDRTQYLGTDQRGDAAIKDLHFPGLHPDASRWLVDNRKPKAVGIDTASIDYGQSSDFRSHVTLMTANIPAFENVANMDKLPAKGFQIIALPMKIKGGSGGPLRIVANIRN